MNAHPADEFEHPLAEVGDVWDAFEMPDGYSAGKVRERKGTISVQLTEKEPDGVVSWSRIVSPAIVRPVIVFPVPQPLSTT